MAVCLPAGLCACRGQTPSSPPPCWSRGSAQHGSDAYELDEGNDHGHQRGWARWPPEAFPVGSPALVLCHLGPLHSPVRLQVLLGSVRADPTDHLPAATFYVNEW